MSSVYYSSLPSEWRETDAVIIDEQDQPTGAFLSGGSRVAHMAGEFPWGPVNTLVKIRTHREMSETFFGFAKDAAQYKGYRSFVGKQWSGLEVVRVANPNDTKAKLVIKNSTGNAMFTIEALYPGAAGNEIEARVVDVVGFVATLEIRWGEARESFRIVGGTGTIAPLESKFVTITDVENPADYTQTGDDWGTLTGGTTGAITELHYLGTLVNPAGLSVLSQGTDGGVWFAADYTSQNWYTELLKVVREKKGIGAVQVVGKTIDEMTVFAQPIGDDRIVFFGPRGKQYIDGAVYDVDMASFGASVIVNTAPNLSIAEERWEKLLSSLLGMADNFLLSREHWIMADQAGIVLPEKSVGGYRFHMGITSSKDKSKTLLLRRRMTDYVNENVATALSPWRNKAPLEEHRLGAKLAIIQKLELLKGTDAAPDTKAIKEYLVEESAVDAYSVEYKISVKLYGEMRYLIAHVQVGENVTITEK